MKKDVKPGLFGQKHSSRDYTKEANWGKNIFNSSFPASLVAYMSCKGVKPVYLFVDESNNLVHGKISGAELFRIDPLSRMRSIILNPAFQRLKSTIRATARRLI